MTVQHERDGAVSILTMNRPDVLNAFNDEMGSALLEAVRADSADPDVRCIVITGAGRAFSSGEDLAALSDGYERGEVPPLGDTLVRRYNPLIEAIVTAPKPVVAAVNGVAAGAGASVAFACDMRVASEKARFVLAFVKAGLVPDSGALWFLVRSIGLSRAMELAALGDPVDATTAHGWGLVNRVASPEDFGTAWRGLAFQLAAGPTRALALMKRLALDAVGPSLSLSLTAEIDAQSQAGRSADHMEGMQAFLGKRPPGFTGR